MKTPLLTTLIFCAYAGVAAGQSRVSGAGASAAATVSVQVVGAGGAGFSWGLVAGAGLAQRNGGTAPAGGRAPELLIQLWRSPAAPARAGQGRELVAEGRTVQERDVRSGRTGVPSSRLDAALAAAAHEPGRYTVAVIY